MPPSPSASKTVAEESKETTEAWKATRHLRNTEDPRDKGKKRTVGIYLAHLRSSRVYNTPFETATSKIIAVSSYKENPPSKTFKDVKIYVHTRGPYTPTKRTDIGSVVEKSIDEQND